MRTFLMAMLLSSPLAGFADTPAHIAGQYKKAAGGLASADRGERLFRGQHDGGKVAACTSCHTQDPKNSGSHERTRKPIEPLAPVANSERFTDLAKVEKWFKRNCNDVLGRECTVGEKADFTAFMLTVR
ncbi:MAG: DUF1924 domain-containing protein [Thiobacillus sp.]